MKAINSDGTILLLETDDSWKGNLKEFDDWETLDFNDSDWTYATVKGKASDQPWGDKFLKNMGGSTTPYRPLSINLSSPYIQDFNEMPDIVYDVKNESAARIGWYRFEAPPGVKEIVLHKDKARVWINETEVVVDGGVAKITNPPSGVSKVAVCLEMQPGDVCRRGIRPPATAKACRGHDPAGAMEQLCIADLFRYWYLQAESKLR